MNREQRRHLPKMTKEEIAKKILLMEKILKEAPNDIQEGQMVKLDCDKIKSHPDYYRLEYRYKQYVEDHKDNILTVKFDDKYPNHAIVALVDESGEESIWRFHIIDLIILKEE